MKISVIVVTRNEGAELRRTVENLRDTLPARSEIVIVDDASTDGSDGGFPACDQGTRYRRGARAQSRRRPQ